MVRQNENDVRCTGGNLITRPLSVPLSTRTGRGEERKFLLFFEEGIGSLTLGGCSSQASDRRWIGEWLDNYRDKLSRQVSLARGREGVGAGGIGWAYFPNANGRNNPYFTSRWHRVVALFFSHASRKEESLFAKFSREFSVALCRGGEREGEEASQAARKTSRLTLSAPLWANFLFAIFFPARRRT